MNSGETSTLQTYRVIITRRSAAELLLSRGDPDGASRGCGSPGPKTRGAIDGAHTAREAARNYCLFVPGHGDIGASARNRVCRHGIVAAKRQSAGGHVLDALPSALRKRLLSKVTSAQSFKARSKKWTTDTAEPNRGPFARPDWVKELFQWIQEHIGPLGLRVTGRFQPVERKSCVQPHANRNQRTCGVVQSDRRTESS